MKQRTRAVLVPLAVMAAALSANVAGQQPPQARPSERGAELLPLTFALVSADGSPVTDLQAADVKVRLSGRERVVRSLQLVSPPGSAAGESAAAELPSRRARILVGRCSVPSVNSALPSL